MKLSVVPFKIAVAILAFSITASAQTWTWARQIAALPGSQGNSNRVTGIAVDPNESVYLIGDYGDSVMLGDIKLVAPPTQSDESYVACINSSGVYQWARSLGSQSFDEALDICSDPQGNSYVAIDFEGTLELDSLQLNGVSIASVAIAKYNSNGGIVWARLFWNALAGPGGIAYSDGYVYAAINRTMIKYTTDGDTVWVHSMPDNVATPFEYNDVAIDPDGNIVATGSFTYRAIIGTDTLWASSVTDVDMFVAKYDEDGNPLWAKDAGAAPANPTQVDVGRAVAVAPTGEIYVAGRFKGTAQFDADSVVSGGAAYEMFIAKYFDNGDYIWVKGGNGTNGSNSDAYDVAVLSNNDVLVAAQFTSRVSVADTSFNVLGTSDVIMLRLAPDGSRRFAKRSDSSITACQSNALALSPDKSAAYVGGQFESPVTFGPNTMTVVSAVADGWIAKMAINTLTDVEEIAGVPLPVSNSLMQNYPNPFNPTTTIEFHLPHAALVHVTIYNLLGERVRTLVDKELAAGSYETEWDGKDDVGHKLASGVYLYRLDAGDFTESRKMELLK